MLDLIDDILAAHRIHQTTPTTLIRQLLEQLAAWPDTAVWISRATPEALLARAAALEADPTAPELPLYGVPFAVKDNIDASGFVTTAGCPAFAYQPASDSEVVRRLLAAGAILIGKTNLDQFATGLVGTRSPYGAPSSVFSRDHISGGSSSGSAVAVAAGLVAFALGTDTAGSGRVPAGFNNIVGFKPTKGLISTSGVVPACRSLDCISIFARDSAGAARVLEVLAGDDPADPFTRVDRRVTLPNAGLRVGILRSEDRVFNGDDRAAALYEAAIARLAPLGHKTVEIDYQPFREAAALLYDGPYVAERLAAIEPFFRSNADAMDPVVRTIIGASATVPATAVFEAEYCLRRLARQAAGQWRQMDVLLLPTTPTIFTHAEIKADPIRNNSVLGLYTNFVNLLDYAATAVPGGFRADGLPAGVTLVGPAFSDRDLARIGGALHSAAACGSGLDRSSTPPATVPREDARRDEILLAVAGAHLSGLPLNHQLRELDARLVETTRTALTYRLLALANTVPPKPGLVRTPTVAGRGIEVEIWALDPAAFGRFVAGLPQPMVIGKVELADGRLVSGFLCEPCAADGATDITHYGGWRNFVSHNADTPSGSVSPS